MKKMKLILSFFLITALTLSINGCGRKNDNTSNEGKKYLIATDTSFPPFEIPEGDGSKLSGIDIDIVNSIAADQGFLVEYNSLGFDAALLAVESGQADGVIAGMSITDKRKESFDFSEPYFDAEVTMAVSIESGITSYDDLKDKKVAIKTGTNGGMFAKSIAEKYGFTITEFKDSPTMYQDVLSGNSAACFEDYPVMAYNIKKGAGLVIPNDIREAGSSYGFAVKKGQNPALLTMFNEGLKNIKNNGELDKIVEKYTK